MSGPRWSHQPQLPNVSHWLLRHVLQGVEVRLLHMLAVASHQGGHCSRIPGGEEVKVPDCVQYLQDSQAVHALWCGAAHIHETGAVHQDGMASGHRVGVGRRTSVLLSALYPEGCAFHPFSHHRGRHIGHGIQRTLKTKEYDPSFRLGASSRCQTSHHGIGRVTIERTGFQLYFTCFAFFVYLLFFLVFFCFFSP